MDVVVIGAGGVGGFLAALLGRAGHQVSVLARGKHLEAIQARGLELRSRQFGDVRVQATASNDPASLHPGDLVVLGVKMYDSPLQPRPRAGLSNRKAWRSPSRMVSTRRLI